MNNRGAKQAYSPSNVQQRLRAIKFTDAPKPNDESSDSESESKTPRKKRKNTRKKSKWGKLGKLAAKKGGFSMAMVDRAIKDADVPVRDTRWVLKNIHMIYMERISMGFAEIVQPLGEFVFDFFLRKYGLPSVATRHLQAVIKNAAIHSADHEAISLFNDFICKRLSLEHLNFTLEVILLCKKVHPLLQLPFAPRS